MPKFGRACQFSITSGIADTKEKREGNVVKSQQEGPTTCGIPPHKTVKRSLEGKGLFGAREGLGPTRKRGKLAAWDYPGEDRLVT